MDDRSKLTEKRLQRVEDERAIVQNIYTYCAAFDQRRQEEWLDCFTEDAILTFEPSAKVAETRGRRHFEGRKQLSDFFADSEKLVRFEEPTLLCNQVGSGTQVTGNDQPIWIDGLRAHPKP